MTQVSRYGHMLKVTVNGMRMTVRARYRVDGSVLNDTIQGRMLGAESALMNDGVLSAHDKRRTALGSERDILEILGVVDHYTTLNTLSEGMQIESDIVPRS